MARARRFSASAIVQVCRGGVKRRLTTRNPTSAVASAGASPPTVATVTTSSRKSSRTLGRLTSSRIGTRTALRAGTPSAASAHPAARRRGASVAGWRRTRGTVRSPSASSSGRCEMTWTSMGPDSRTTRLMTEPRTSSVTRDRRLAPSTSWVAFSARAKSTSAAATSLPDDLVVRAAELVQQIGAGARCARSSSPSQPVVGAHVHAEQLAACPAGHPGGPPDEVARRRARR